MDGQGWSQDSGGGGHRGRGRRALLTNLFVVRGHDGLVKLARVVERALLLGRRGL